MVRKEARSDTAGRPLRVLLVEDNVDHLNLLRLALERTGIEVVCVTDGAEALAALAVSLKGAHFDVVVADVAMRHVDGLAFKKAVGCLQDNDLLPGPLPVKIHSAYPESHDAVERGKVDACDYYLKGDGTLRLINDLEEMACAHRGGH